MRSPPAVFLAIAILLLGSAAAQAVVIDSFDTGDPFVLENTNQGVTLIQSANVLGGIREVVTLDLVEFDPAIGMTLTVTPTRGNGGYLAFIYHAGGVDLTSGGLDRFRVTIDPGQGFGPDTTYMEVVIFVDGWPFRVSGTPPDGVFEIPYGAEASRVANADEISVAFLGNNSFQNGEYFIVTDVRAIPEPSTGLLVMTGLLGLAYRQRRRGRTSTLNVD